MDDDTSTKPAVQALEPVTTGKTFERRGLIAAAWAAVAALVLTKTTTPVEAAAGQQFQDTAGGGFVNNSAGGPSAIFSNSTYTSTSPTFVGYAFQGSATAGVAGVSGSGSANAPIPCGTYGLQNKSVAGSTAGVLGHNVTTTGIGVLGWSGTGPSSFQDGVGVQGESGGGIGVLGRIVGTKNSIGVYGSNFSSYAGPGPGAGGFGCYGYSALGHGLVGATGTSGAAAVVGATNGIPGAYAAVFYGPVAIQGALSVAGAKSAAVPHPDGSHRLVYCVESPESLFEDFGKSRLACGQADVAIDPDFAAITDLEDYHVFVTVYDQHNDLLVSHRTPQGFRVQAKDDTSTAAFSWRIVGRRKDIVAERMAKVSFPPPPELPVPPPMTELSAGEPVPGRGRIPQ